MELRTWIGRTGVTCWGRVLSKSGKVCGHLLEWYACHLWGGWVVHGKVFFVLLRRVRVRYRNPSYLGLSTLFSLWSRLADTQMHVLAGATLGRSYGMILVETVARSTHPDGLAACLRFLVEWRRPPSGSMSEPEASDPEIESLWFFTDATLNIRRVFRPASSAFEILARSSMPSNLLRGCKPRADLRRGVKSSSVSESRLALLRGILRRF